MSRRTITVLQAPSNHGKTKTIWEVHRILDQIHKGRFTHMLSPANSHDVRSIITANNKTIGINSCGDPGHLKIEDLESLLNNREDLQIDHIVCASRSKGETTQIIHAFAKKHNFHTIWTKPYACEMKDLYPSLNKLRAEEIINMIYTTSF